MMPLLYYLRVETEEPLTKQSAAAPWDKRKRAGKDTLSTALHDELGRHERAANRSLSARVG